MFKIGITNCACMPQLNKQIFNCARDFVRVTSIKFADIKSTAKTSLESPNVNPQNSSSKEPLKQLKVAIIGVPNAGKSTLINQLMNLAVCPASRKAHTTRVNQKAIYLKENVQLVFVDTPGVVNPKEKKMFKLPDDFVNAPSNSARDADLIAVIHSIENKILRNKLDPKVIGVLQRLPSKPSILIVNKIDIIRGRKSLLDTVYFLCAGKVNDQPIIRRTKNEFMKAKALQMAAIFKKTREQMKGTSHAHTEGPQAVTMQDDNGREVRGWSSFKDVFVISAKNGDGIDSLRDYLIAMANPVEQWEYGKDVLTDSSPAELCVRMVKSKLLDYIKHEIPYMLTPVLEFWEVGPDGTLRVVVKIEAPTPRAYSKVLGKEGSVLKIVQNEVQEALRKLLSTEVSLYLHLECKKIKKSLNA